MTCPNLPPLEMATYAFTNYYFGAFFYPIVWGIILGILYLRSKNPMMVSFIGLLIASFFTGAIEMQTSATAELFNYGYLLVGLSIGLVLFFAFKTKITNPAV